MSPTEGSSGGGRSTCLSFQRSESLSKSFLGLGERSDQREDLSFLLPRSLSRSLSLCRSRSRERDLDLERDREWCRLFLSPPRSLSRSLSLSLSLCLSRSLLRLRCLLFSDLWDERENLDKATVTTLSFHFSKTRTLKKFRSCFT